MQDDSASENGTPAVEPEAEAVIHQGESTESAADAIDQLSDSDAVEIAEGEPDEQQTIEMQLPLQSLDLTGARLRIVPHPDGSGQKGIVIGPILVQMIMPLTAEACRQVARQLNGGIEVARVVPPMSRRGKG